MSERDLPKAYDPASVEAELYRDWVEARLFHAEPDHPGEPFSIVIPPPNVTGSLHIGHALTYAIEDAMIRRARMEGRNAVWVPGMDHAGIATQNVVERELAAEGLSRHDLGREAFIERVWQWKREYGGQILNQTRRLGASLDWEREAFTFDDERSRAVREVFVTLHEEGLIYRGTRLINWCPRCMTALSDIEVDHEEVDGELAYLRYPAMDGSEGVVVATTRAETMLGDTAVAVHPDDERYAHLVGTTLRLPLVEREIPVIADEAVDREFGTGAVKVTPAHDWNDHAIAERHGLPMIDVMTDTGEVSEAGGPFARLPVREAREAVKRALDEEGLLVEVRPHRHPIGVCSRCGTVVEPRLSEQWFVAVTPLAEAAITAVEDGRVTFSPERFTKPFLDWLANLHDWCISRQIWWGHRIPAWSCPDGHTTVAREDPAACATCGREELVQDEDVLDTWFSSQLWPFTVFGWPDETPELETWYPTSVLETGYDINTFWVSRMLMIGLHFCHYVPFRHVHNHGMVRDQHGRKMSKSAGNVIDPLDFIDRYGADALRFALVEHSSPGQDVPLAEDWVEGARRFANKLWNATRLALQTLDGTRPADGLPEDLALEDRWVLSRLEACRAEVDEATSYGVYDWSRAARALYQFAWNELADWYLEVAKVRLYDEDDPAARRAAQRVLAVALDDLLRLLHPFMPFVTEALWRHLTGASGGRQSLATAAWPRSRSGRDQDTEQRFAALQEVVTEVRRFRSDHAIAPGARFDLTVVSSRRHTLEPTAPLIASLAGLSRVTFADDAPADTTATTRIVLPTGEGFVPLDVIDVEGELQRLRRERDNARGERERAAGKLANQQFVRRAPSDVVQAERDKLAQWEQVIATLEAEILRLDGGAGGEAA